MRAFSGLTLKTGVQPKQLSVCKLGFALWTLININAYAVVLLSVLLASSAINHWPDNGNPPNVRSLPVYINVYILMQSVVRAPLGVRERKHVIVV